MKLLEVDGLYFWVTVWELHKEDPKPDILLKLRNASWQIADKLREVDDMEHLDELLYVLMADGYPTARARAEAIQALLAKLAKTVNPHYAKAIAAVSAANMTQMQAAPRAKTNAPGRMAL